MLFGSFHINSTRDHSKNDLKDLVTRLQGFPGCLCYRNSHPTATRSGYQSCYHFLWAGPDRTGAMAFLKRVFHDDPAFDFPHTRFALQNLRSVQPGGHLRGHGAYCFKDMFTYGAFDAFVLEATGSEAPGSRHSELPRDPSAKNCR